MHHLDRDAVHFRDRRIGAADREQRQQREIAEQRGERTVVHRLNHANASELTGASPRNTQGNGQCMMATPVKARIAITGAEFHRLLEQRRRHLGDHRDQQAGGGGGDAGENAAERFEIAEARIQAPPAR